MRVVFWSKRPLAFKRADVPLARRIAYHLSLGVSRGKLGTGPHHLADTGTQHVDVAGPRGLDAVRAAAQLRVVGKSVEWRDVLRKATQVSATDTTVLVTGDSGTGKIVARFIHAASAPKKRALRGPELRGVA